MPRNFNLFYLYVHISLNIYSLVFHSLWLPFSFYKYDHLGLLCKFPSYFFFIFILKHMEKFTRIYNSHSWKWALQEDVFELYFQQEKIS